jgi:hypothetical protein
MEGASCCCVCDAVESSFFVLAVGTRAGTCRQYGITFDESRAAGSMARITGSWDMHKPVHSLCWWSPPSPPAAQLVGGAAVRASVVQKKQLICGVGAMVHVLERGGSNRVLSVATEQAERMVRGVF